MLILILLLVVGSMLVYISQFNFMLVTVNLGFYTFSAIPLFYVIVGSFVLGLTFAYIIHLVQAIPVWLALRKKDNEIKKDKGEVLELTKRVHQLEIENEKLGTETGIVPEDKNAL